MRAQSCAPPGRISTGSPRPAMVRTGWEGPGPARTLRSGAVTNAVATAATTAEAEIWPDPKITRISPSATPSTTHCATDPRMPVNGEVGLEVDALVLIFRKPARQGWLITNRGGR